MMIASQTLVENGVSRFERHSHSDPGDERSGQRTGSRSLQIKIMMMKMREVPAKELPREIKHRVPPL